MMGGVWEGYGGSGGDVVEGGGDMSGESPRSRFLSV